MKHFFLLSHQKVTTGGTKNFPLKALDSKNENVPLKVATKVPVVDYPQLVHFGKPSIDCHPKKIVPPKVAITVLMYFPQLVHFGKPLMEIRPIFFTTFFTLRWSHL